MTPKMLASAPRLPGPVDYALLTTLGVIWGISFTLVKIAVGSVPAIPFTIIRVGLTATAMLALLWWVRERLPPLGRTWIFIGLSALMGNSLAFLLIAWGQEKVDGGLAAILMSPSPLFAAVLAHIFTRDDRLNGYKLAGIALGIVGIAVLMGIGNIGEVGGADWRHQLMILAAGCCYGANVVINRGLTGGSAVGNITAVMVVSTLLMLPLSLVPGAWSFTPTTGAIIAIGLLVIFSMCAGTLMLLDLVRRQGAAFASQVNFLVPVFGVLSAAVILAERPAPRAIAGLALVLIGVAIARRGSGLRPPLATDEAAGRTADR